MATAEDLIPAVFQDLVEPWEPSIPEFREDFLPEFAGGCLGEEDEWISEDAPLLDDGDSADNKFPPRFRGVPRF